MQVPLPPAESVAPVDSGLVLSDFERQPEPYLGDPDADRAAERAARRAQVRRERQRDSGVDETAAPEMLVLSADEASCSELCALLSAFGFSVQVMAEPPGLPAPWPFVAVFIAMPISTADGGDAIDLCNRVRESSRLPGQTRPLLVLAAQQVSATDRVRAGLAGCHEILIGGRAAAAWRSCSTRAASRCHPTRGAVRPRLSFGARLVPHAHQRTQARAPRQPFFGQHVEKIRQPLGLAHRVHRQPQVATNTTPNISTRSTIGRSASPAGSCRGNRW